MRCLTQFTSKKLSSVPYGLRGLADRMSTRFPAQFTCVSISAALHFLMPSKSGCSNHRINASPRKASLLSRRNPRAAGIKTRPRRWHVWKRSLQGLHTSFRQDAPQSQRKHPSDGAWRQSQCMRISRRGAERSHYEESVARVDT